MRPSRSILGAVLGGGQSRRFGSDKAQALHDNKALLDHVAQALRPQVDALVVAGRDWPGLTRVDDLPSAGLGPLGGLAGALSHASTHGFSEVLTIGCDMIAVPANLVALLGDAPAIIDDLPILGLWPVATLPALLAWLDDPANRSVYRFADMCGAARRPALGLANINHPSDLTYGPDPKRPRFTPPQG
jgi:molybdenum cofactor guanylyltransferase